MTCECGHERDEHDRQGACTAPDCPCFYFEGAAFLAALADAIGETDG